MGQVMGDQGLGLALERCNPWQAPGQDLLPSCGWRWWGLGLAVSIAALDVAWNGTSLLLPSPQFDPRFGVTGPSSGTVVTLRAWQGGWTPEFSRLQGQVQASPTDLGVKRRESATAVRRAQRPAGGCSGGAVQGSRRPFQERLLLGSSAAGLEGRGSRDIVLSGEGWKAGDRAQGVRRD